MHTCDYRGECACVASVCVVIAIKFEGLSPVKPKFDRTGRDEICWAWLTVRVQLQLFAICCYLLQEGPIVPCITGDALGRGEPFTSTAGSMREV